MKPAALGLAAVATTLALGGTLAWQAQRHVVAAGFWFEDGALELERYQIERLGGPLTADERASIAALARSELTLAFADLRIAIAENREAMYRVRVVHHLERHPLSPFRRAFDAAGESRAVRPLGGRGAVSVRVLAGNAIDHAPPTAGRQTILDGLGRGIGRTAAHELAHQLLPTSPLHDSQDVSSYEYFTAARPEQYYGTLRWDVAGPLLVKRLGRRDDGARAQRPHTVDASRPAF